MGGAQRNPSLDRERKSKNIPEMRSRRTENMRHSYQIFPVGIVHKDEKSTEIEIYDDFTDGLLGLDSFSHIIVLYWFHHNDTPQQRATLQVHPRGNKANPLTGVFGTHSPARPNLIAISTCKILSITANRIRIDGIDAVDRTPVIDIKSYFPHHFDLKTDIKLPDWVKKRKRCR